MNGGRQALVCRAPLDVVLVQIRSVSLLLFSRPSFSWVAQKRRREGHRERLRETAVKHFLLCDEASLASLDIYLIVETCESERLVDFSYTDVPVGSNSEHVIHTVSRLRARRGQRVHDLQSVARLKLQTSNKNTSA